MTDNGTDSLWHSLDMLGITVWLDGKTVDVTGVLIPEDDIVHTSSRYSFSGSEKRGKVD